MAVSATSSSANRNGNSNNNKTKRRSSPKAKEALTSCHKKKNGNATATTSSSNNNNKDRYPNYRDFGRAPFDCGHKFYSSTSLDLYDPEDSSDWGRGGSATLGHGGGGSRGGKKSTFPKMLYEMVDDADGVQNNYTDVIAWMPHGRSFVIKDKHRFTDEILPRHFGSQNSFASFQRQLNVYGFLRMTKAGPDRKSYYHELFLRGRPDLIAYIPRKRKTTARVRRSLDPSTEPNLYLFPPCLARKSGIDGGAEDFDPTAGVAVSAGPFDLYGVIDNNNNNQNDAAFLPMAVPSNSNIMIFQQGPPPVPTLSYEPPQADLTSSSYDATLQYRQLKAPVVPASILSHEEEEEEVVHGDEELSLELEEEEEGETNSTCSSTSAMDELEYSAARSSSSYHQHPDSYTSGTTTTEYDWQSQFIVASTTTLDEQEIEQEHHHHHHRVTPEQSYSSIIDHHAGGAGSGVGHLLSSAAVVADMANLSWEDEDDLDRF